MPLVQILTQRLWANAGEALCFLHHRTNWRLLVTFTTLDGSQSRYGYFSGDRSPTPDENHITISQYRPYTGEAIPFRQYEKNSYLCMYITYNTE